MHLVQEALVQVVCPQPLLRCHPGVVPPVEGQLEHAPIDVDVEEVVVLSPCVGSLAQCAAARRARHLANLLPSAGRYRPLVQHRLALAVLDNLVLPLARAGLGERVLRGELGDLQLAHHALHLLRRHLHRRNLLPEAGLHLEGRAPAGHPGPDVRLAVSASRDHVAVG
eukprot:scaffold5664_cov115-Isochrysis_galbana.AAC.7